MSPHATREGPEPVRASGADKAALAVLSEQFRPALIRYFRRRRLSEADADDAVQDVFLRLSRRLGLADMENVEGYLFETAASVAVDHQRRAHRRRTDRHEAYDDNLHAKPALGPDRTFEGRENVAALLTGLLELPERTRHIFILARLEQMRHAEIARRLGVSVSAVEKHVVKALAHLARRVEGAS